MCPPVATAVSALARHAVLPVRRDLQHHYRGVGFAQRREVEAERAEASRCTGVDDEVRVRHQRARVRDALSRCEVQHHAALARAEVREEHAVVRRLNAVGPRRQVAHGVPLGRFDDDDVRAVEREQAAREGARDVRAELHHARAFEHPVLPCASLSSPASRGWRHGTSASATA